MTIYDWPLIDGRPWGHGAVSVDLAPVGWVCPGCRRTSAGKAESKRRLGRHFYPWPLPAAICTECAAECVRRWWSIEEYARRFAERAAAAMA